MYNAGSSPILTNVIFSGNSISKIMAMAADV